MLELTPILVLLIIFGFIYGVVLLGIRKKERMVLLEKGADPKTFYAEPTRITSLKWGLFLIGIAIGIFLGNILSATTIIDEEVAYFSMIFLFGGLALVISHFLEKKQKKEDEE
jgi:predicted MFS family arabinose efflux permease